MDLGHHDIHQYGTFFVSCFKSFAFSREVFSGTPGLLVDFQRLSCKCIENSIEPDGMFLSQASAVLKCFINAASRLRVRGSQESRKVMETKQVKIIDIRRVSLEHAFEVTDEGV